MHTGTFNLRRSCITLTCTSSRNLKAFVYNHLQFYPICALPCCLVGVLTHSHICQRLLSFRVFKGGTSVSSYLAKFDVSLRLLSLGTIGGLTRRASRSCHDIPLNQGCFFISATPWAPRRRSGLTCTARTALWWLCKLCLV